MTVSLEKTITGIYRRMAHEHTKLDTILCAATICAFIHRLAGAASALQIACVEQPHGAICAAIASR
ncbi:MAG: hypothetical protein WC091_14120, partial [Sulfuricellaceae bacterium]